MNLRLRAVALTTTFALTACGGGGGGGTSGGAPTPSGPQAVVITDTNAKPVGANALDTAQNTSATRGATGLPVGVTVDSGSAPLLQVIAEAARFAATTGATALPVAIGLSQTVQCTFGGTMTISGRAANPQAGLFAGDALTISTSNCALSTGGSTATMNGQMTMTVMSGSITGIPFHVVVTTTAANLSVTSSGITAVANGDVTLDWTANSATSQTLIATGTTMSTRETINATAHTNTMRNFTQQVTISGSTLTGTVSGTVETDSSRLGSGTVSYTISTPTAVVWNGTTRAATAGAIKVVGANNSQLLLTINGDGSVTIQVDANGDGTYEKVVTSTVGELAGLI